MLVANKCNPTDIREITTEEERELANRENLMFTEVSIEDYLTNLVTEIVNSIDTNSSTVPKEGFFSKLFKNKKKQNEKPPKPAESDHTKDPNDMIKNVSVSPQNFDKIVTHVRFLENHLQQYENINSFNFNGFMDQKHLIMAQ